ncbi:MAG TPA: hypothetical protein VIF88_03885 [Methylocystis sp.]
MTLDQAVASYIEASAEADHWQVVCADFTKAFGIGVWRGGHPLDREKLRQRWLWRYRRNMAMRWVRQALEAWSPDERPA